jgi:hypothetical protein
MDVVKGPVGPPFVEVPPYGALGREVLGNIPPLAAGAENVKDRINDVPHVRLARASSGIHGDVRLDQSPLLVGYITGVMVRSHTTLTSLGTLLFTLLDRL